MKSRKLFFEASPLSYVTVDKNSTRFPLVYGREDDIVDPATQSEKFLTELKQAGFYARTIVVPGAGHFWASEPIGRGRMFGLFKKKSHLDDAVKVQLESAITSLLSLQILILPDPQIEDANGNINRKALGYIYGHIDAFLRTRGYDMADSEMSVPLTFHVLRKLFPAGNPTRYLEFLIHNLDDQMVTLGCMAGGQQYLDYRKPNTEGSPMGLARFILEAMARPDNPAKEQSKE
jgi:hypothetical protein